MPIKKNYKIKHHLLKVLYYHSLQFEAKEYKNRDKVSLHFSKLKEQLLQYDQEILIDNLDVLGKEGDIHRQSGEYNSSSFYITSKGVIAYTDKSYLRKGRQDRLNYIYDFAKTILIILVIITTIWTFVRHIVLERQNSAAIEQIQTRLKVLDKK